MTLDEAKTVVSQMISDLNVQRVRLDNLIVSEDWAGVHYWNVITGEDDARTPLLLTNCSVSVNAGSGF